MNANEHKIRRWIPCTIIALAMLLRVVAGIWRPMVDPNVLPDAGDYDGLAKAMLTGGDYHTPPAPPYGGIATRMPGYPAMVAGIYAIAGFRPAAMLVFQALLGGVTCWMIYRMLRGQAGVIAAAFFALDPLSIGMSASLLSETPFALALIGIVWIGQRLLNRPEQWGMWVLIGIISATAIYLRAAALYLPAVIVALILARRATWRTACFGLVTLVIVAAGLLPWKWFVGRHEETVELAGLTSLEGISLYEAVYAKANGGPMQGEILATMPPEILALREADRDAFYRKQAWKEIRENPGRVAGLMPVKFSRFWSPGLNETTLAGSKINVVLWCWYLPLFGLAIAGAVRGMMHGRRLGMVLLPILYFTLLHVLFMGSVRYRVPLHPLICMLAGMGLCYVFGKRNKTSEV